MNTRLKLCIIITNVDKALSFEWAAVALKEKYDLSYVLLNASDGYFESFLKSQNIKVKRIFYSGKKDTITAFSKVLAYFIKSKPDIIHANFIESQIIGLSAAKLAGVKVRIYTRHHSNYHHQYFPNGLKYDKLSNKLATKIISISQATDKSLLELEHVPADKVAKIYHGFNFSNLLEIDDARINAVKQRWQIPSNNQIVGVIARFDEYKGIQYIIPAFKKYLAHYPDAFLLLANARGNYKSHVLKLLEGVPPKNYVLVDFEKDIAALYHTFDYYVHVPIDEISEAFGLTYVESLALGIPSVFTLSGIAQEMIINRENAMVVNFKNSDEIYEALLNLSSDQNLRALISSNGKTQVKTMFDFEEYIKKLEILYNHN